MSRLVPPSLGPRGEGWVAAQLVLLWLVIAVGFRWGGAWAGSARAVTTAVAAVVGLGGAGLALRGVLDLGRGLTPLPRPRDDARLVETGAYALVRHPVYGGIVLLSVAWGLFAASPIALVLSVVLLGFFRVKSAREETWLEERFPGYRAYRDRTRRLLPWLY